MEILCFRRISKKVIRAIFDGYYHPRAGCFRFRIRCSSEVPGSPTWLVWLEGPLRCGVIAVPANPVHL